MDKDDKFIELEYPEMARAFGWIPDTPDQRDIKYSMSFSGTLPQKVDLHTLSGPVVNQGSLGSCVGQAVAAAHLFVQIKTRAAPLFFPSRLMIYYNAREIEDSVLSDSGCMIRDAIKSVVDQGVCPEVYWPYRISRFARKPPNTAYQHASLHQVIQYQRLNGLQHCKTCLAEGYPFIFGFSVYDSFQTYQVATTGKAPIPKMNERLLGGHAVLAVGYDDANQWLICKNSWGLNWGERGYFYLPYEFVTNPELSDDYWRISQVEA